jgi:hypothetical protein
MEHLYSAHWLGKANGRRPYSPNFVWASKSGESASERVGCAFDLLYGLLIIANYINFTLYHSPLAWLLYYTQ